MEITDKDRAEALADFTNNITDITKCKVKTIRLALSALRNEYAGEQCKYAVISRGIGLDNKVTEIKLHCKKDSDNDYTETLVGRVRKRT